MDFSPLLSYFSSPSFVQAALNVLYAIIVLVVGWKLSGLAGRFVDKQLHTRKVDETLIPFLCSIITFGLKALVVVTAGGMMGIQTASFIAVLGAASFAIGLALQGNLSNL